MLNSIVLIILIATTLLSIIFVIIDERKIRAIQTPFVSFLMSTYKDAEYLEKSIENLHQIYPKSELIAINDNSPDNTAEILGKFKEKYPNWLTILTNETNRGKAISINEGAKITKGEIIVIIDSDTKIEQSSLNDMLARLLYKENIGAVSCRYKVQNRSNFLAKMQEIEYIMLAFIQGAYNLFSTISLWGGCMAFKKEAWNSINGLKANYLTEDMNSALELQEKGWRVQQSSFPVYTNVPEKLKDWYKQKIRWCSGFFQCFFTHYKIYLKNPIAVFFTLSYVAFMILFLFGAFQKLFFIWDFGKVFYSFCDATSFYSGAKYMLFLIIPSLLYKFLIAFSYPLLSLSYLLYDDFYRKNFIQMLLIFPYTFIYFPVYIMLNVIAFTKTIKILKNKNRAW